MRLTGPVELNVAADPSMMLVVRLTTAGVLARAGLTMDIVDNLKMATEEACNCLIGQTNPPKKLNLRFDCTDDRLTVTAAAKDCDAPRGAADETELEIVRCILSSLAGEVSLDVQQGWIRSIELRTALA